jgi:hypothetical protein
MAGSGPNNRAVTGGPAEFTAGFQRVESELRALPEQELEALNLDVPSAVATVLGALPEIRRYREQLAALPGFDLASFDKLDDYANALAHSHAMYRSASAPADGVSDLAEELGELRDVLQTDALALAKRKILDETRVMKLRSGNGFKNIAFEVVGLVGLFREHWDAVQGRSALQLEELEHAAKRARELVTAVGVREQAPAVVGAAASLRQRAFTLLVRTYDETRQAIAYLRRKQRDTDDIAPSLFAGRRGTSAEPEPTATPDEPAAPPVPTATNLSPAAPAPTAPPGFPGSSPFVRS